MTRINSDLDPSILMDQHLMAEYRELPMVFASLKRSLKTKSVREVLDSIPPRFTLNSGHVTFFYDKLLFLHNRYQRLVDHLHQRGYSLDPDRSMYDYKDFPVEFHNDWVATRDDNLVVATRIREKFMMKPEWYKYFGDDIDTFTFEHLYAHILKGDK